MIGALSEGAPGLCPGPALVNLATLMPEVIVFVLAMAAGLVAKDQWDKFQPGIGTEAPSVVSDGQT